MFLVKAFEYIILILIIMFAAVFAICGVGMILTKETINKMMKFKGDDKNEQ